MFPKVLAVYLTIPCVYTSLFLVSYCVCLISPTSNPMLSTVENVTIY